MNKEWFLARLKEPSTWRGISLFLAATGVSVAPEFVYQIGTAVMAVIGAIEMARKEEK